MDKVIDSIKAERESKLGLSNETEEASEAQTTSVSVPGSIAGPSTGCPILHRDRTAMSITVYLSAV